MKLILSKKYWLTLTSSLAVGTGIILACAGDWDDTYSTSNFTPGAFVDSSYNPFFYSPFSFYSGGYDTEHDTRFNGSNVNDWSAYLGSAASRTELEYLLRTATEGAIDSAAGYVAGKIKTLPASMQSFQLLKKADNKAAAFLAYLSLAKKSEAFAVNNLEYAWDYESKKKNPYYNAKPLNNKLAQEFTQAKDPFIKQRYWFQLERSYFFNDSAQKAINFFESNEKAFPKNELYYRTMAYAAGAYYKLKNYTRANYYYSKVYDGANALKTVAHYSFHPQDENDWKATLALCANNDEKATLWQMLGVFYGDQERAIREIYALNPRSEKLNLLLTRAVNEIEASYGTSYGLFHEINDTTFNALNARINSIAQAGNTSKPYMWNIAAGYLYMRKGNNQQAAALYAQAEKKLPKDKAVQEQLRILKIMNTVSSAPIANAKLEKAILPDLEWLLNDQSKIEVRSQGAINWVKKVLADRYTKQGEHVKAVCFKNDCKFYSDDKNIEALKSFLNKPNKTPYELLVAKQYELKLNDLLEYQAINLTYANKLDEAISKMEEAVSKTGAGTVNPEMPGNPFNGRLQDCHDCDHAAPQKIKYTRLSLLKKMKDMEDKIKAGTDVYTNAMLLANAFYNITWYGNGRAFYDCNVNQCYSDDGARFLNSPVGMELANKYYTLALSVAKTDEQKAKCYFMLAKCERNEFYNGNSTKKYDQSSKPDFLAWDGFLALKQKYSNTQFYKDAIKECGYFRTYTRK